MAKILMEIGIRLISFQMPVMPLKGVLVRENATGEGRSFYLEKGEHLNDIKLHIVIDIKLRMNTKDLLRMKKKLILCVVSKPALGSIIWL